MNRMDRSKAGRAIPAWRVAVVSLILVTAVLFVRKPDAFLNPQFWAEDGTIFFLQQYRLGIESFLETHRGYYHTIQRLFASFTDLFPYAAAPAMYNYSWLLVTLAIVWKIHSPRLGFRYRPLMALTLVLVPHVTGEIFLTLTNVQWVVAVLVFLVALQSAPRNRADRYSDWVVLALCGLTGPFVLLVIPLIVLRAVRHRSRDDLTLLAIAAGTGAVQLFAMTRNPVLADETGNPTLANWASVVGQRLFGNMFLGIRIPYEIDPYLLVLVGSLILAAVVALAWPDPKRRRLVGSFLYYGATMALATFFKFKETPDLLISPFAGVRYFYVPSVMMSWSLITCFGLGHSWRKLLPFVPAALVILSSLASGFRSPPHRDYRWELYAKKIAEGRPLDIPINPPGWFIELRPASSSRIHDLAGPDPGRG